MTRLCAAVMALFAAMAAPALAEDPGPLRPAGVEGPLGHERLSDERTVTRLARPHRIFPLREGPGLAYRRIGKRLRFSTEDRGPEVYLVLRSTVAKSGERWLQLRLPQRPNGSKAWVQRRAMGKLFTVTTMLEIDKRALKGRLFKDGREIWTASLGVGRRSAPTPSGNFWIRQRIENLAGSPAYGPLAFGMSAYATDSDWPGGGVVGIHGTNQPRKLPGRPSAGCIRVTNPKIRQLDRLMPIGTPVWVH